MPRSLGIRAILAASVAVLLALVVAGTGVDLLVGRHLHRSLDRSLRARAVDVAQLSASAPSLLVAPGALDVSLGGGQQASVEVVDGRGRIVARSLSLGGRVLPVQPLLREVIASGRGRYAGAQLGGENLRVYAAPLADSGGAAAGGAVAVASTTGEIDGTVASVHLFVVVTALLAAAAAAAVLALLMRRALSPLGRLTRAAASIEQTGDARRRLPEPDGDDEIGRLAATLNAMLAALERSRDAERRFLADASHELRTPLTALAGNIDFLARYGPTEELVADLQTDTRRMARLADDLLVLSREESAVGGAEVVRLDELARESGADEVVADDPITVPGDRPALERALGNLVDNARRHGRGRVTVEAREDGGQALLIVADEGPGVRPEEQDAAFERFWRGNGGGPGSGLGLAIVRATAERHGGRVFVEGARFTIELPALTDVSESASRTSGEQGKGAP